METTAVKNGAELTIKASGSINTQTSEAFQTAIKNNLTPETKSLMIDLKEVNYVSSAGLRVLLWAQNTMDDTEGTLTVLNVCPEIKEVFDLTGFSDLLTIK